MNKKYNYTFKLLLTIVLLTNSLYASDLLKKVEQEYLNKNYDKAKQEFLNIKNIDASIQYKLERLEEDTSKFLKTLDKANKQIKECVNYDCNRVELSFLNYDYKKYSKYAGYYSKSFRSKIYDEFALTFKNSKKFNKIIIETANNKQIESEQQREKKHKEYLAKREKEKIQKKKQQQEFIVNAKNIDNNIDLKVKKMGYKRFTGLDITSLIYQTQKKGNLTEYLNTVVGCSALRKSDCTDLNSDLKVSQILDDSIMYRYFKIIDGELLEYSIIVPREANKIYQMKQRFDNDFYVFTGMFNYTSTIGIKFSIPKLKKIHIK